MARQGIWRLGAGSKADRVIWDVVCVCTWGVCGTGKSLKVPELHQESQAVGRSLEQHREDRSWVKH